MTMFVRATGSANCRAVLIVGDGSIACAGLYHHARVATMPCREDRTGARRKAPYTAVAGDTQNDNTARSRRRLRPADAVTKAAAFIRRWPRRTPSARVGRDETRNPIG